MGKEETMSRLVRREKTTMEVPKPSSGHGAPDATKPERDNRHADGEHALVPFQLVAAHRRQVSC